MKIMAIDGNNILNRAFYGLKMLTNREGLPTNAVYNFLSILLKLQEDEKPDKIIVCFDVKEKTFRHMKYSYYKSNRKGMPDELAVQVPVAKELLDAMGIARMELTGYEADDLLGSISRQVGANGDTCIIVSGDRDCLQLIDDSTSVYFPTSKAGKPTYTKYNQQTFETEYGFAPIRLIDLKALMGDASDHIPGVPGIGEKTALQLLKQFDTLENIYQNLDDLSIKNHVRIKLRDGEQSAKDSFWLATIDRNAPLPFDPLTVPAAQPDSIALSKLLTRLEFQTFLKRLGLSEIQDTPALPTVTVRQIDAETMELLQNLWGEVYVVTSPSLQAICLAQGEYAYSLFADDFSPEAWQDVLRLLFQRNLSLILHDAKPILTAVLQRGVEPTNIAFDTCLAAYLLAPTQNHYDFSRVALQYCGIQTPELDLDDPAAISPLGGREQATEKCGLYIGALQGLYPEMKRQIESSGMRSLYYDIELPLVRVLIDMETAGCVVDQDKLCAFGKLLDERIARLTEQIYTDAGCTFNIQSPKQLGQILFETLGLPVQKKKKSGYSTDVEVLEKLTDKHPIVSKILEFRQVAKLKGTYVEGLLKEINPKDGRVHTHFQQTVTATGRLSSTAPNLQSIPTRSDYGKEMRKMFVAPDDDHVLVDADYSQIELRILAHIAQDEHMLQAFHENQDIHAATAAKVYHVPLEEVTPQMRSSCKAINFGIIYGMSDFSLAQDLNISRQEASEFIQTYLTTYAGVARYMETIKASAKEKGYVETLCGRRRPLPELQNHNFNIRSFGERAAMNTPIQGTAADIMKIAMLRVYNRLRREGLQSRLILQVHDELILECPKSEETYAMQLLTEEMQDAFPLDAPLVAEAKAGHSWYDAK